MAPRSGTGYIGLDQWLSLNRPAATAMADKMVGGINTAGQKSQGILDGAVEYFNYDVDGNTLNFNEEDPGLTEKTAAEKAKTVYAGPTQLEGYAGFDEGRGIAENVQGDARLASDLYGRQALLQDEYGKGGGYSLGQQRLDSALVGAAGGDKIDAAKAQWGNLLGKYSDASGKAKAYALQGEARTKEAAKQFGEAGAGIKKRAEDAQKAWDKAHRPELQKEMDEEKAIRDREREEDREARKGNSTGGRGGGGGKANVDRWTSSFLT